MTESLVSTPPLSLDDSGDTFRQFLNDFSWISKHIDAARGEFAEKMGLNPAQYSMLMLVSQDASGAASTTNLISEKLHLHQPYVTLHMGKLVDMGLLKRLKNPADKRSVIFRLTQKGNKLMEEIAPLIRLSNDEFFRSLTATEMKSMAKAFRKLATDIEQNLQTRYTVQPPSSGKA